MSISQILGIFINLTIFGGNLNQSKESFENQALRYFVNVVSVKEGTFRNKSYYIPKYTSGKPSSAYNIAYTLGEINLFNNNSPKEQKADSLINIDNKKSHLDKKILSVLAKRKPNRKNVRYVIKVNNVVNYDNRSFVEIELFNSAYGDLKIVSVEFENGIPVRFFFKGMILDTFEPSSNKLHHL